MADILSPEKKAERSKETQGKKLSAMEKAVLLREDPDPNRVWTRITKVPDWLYYEEVTIYWWFGYCYPRKITKASFVWIANFVALIAHVAFACVSVWGATREGKTMATPLIKVYLTKLNWKPESSSPLVPLYEEAGDLYLAHMTLWFFLMSASAHFLVCLCNWKQAFAWDNTTNQPNPEWSRISYWTGWYFVYLHECRNPLRWIEYSFSASLMVSIFAVVGTLSHVYMAVMAFVLMWCTMCFGYFAERLCRPIDMGPDARPLYWAINQWNPHLILFNLEQKNRESYGYYAVARMNRIGPHIAGYVPYVTVFACLIHSFLHSVSSAPENGGPPDFVWAIIVGQAAAFTLFGLTQLFLLVRTDGPSFYYGGEVSYQFLSVLAKGMLGSMLIANVLIFDSFDDAARAADVSG